MQLPRKAEHLRRRLTPTARRRGMFLLAFLGVLLAAGLFLLQRDDSSSREGRNIVIEIPEGAGRLLSEGKEVPQIPNRIEGKVGDTLLVKNNDSSTQFVAGYPVSPHQTLKIPLNRAGTYQTSCSVHRDRTIRMVITS